MLDLIDDAHSAHGRWWARNQTADIPARGGQIVDAGGKQFVILLNCNGPIAVYRVSDDRLRRAADDEWELATRKGALVVEL